MDTHPESSGETKSKKLQVVGEGIHRQCHFSNGLGPW